MTMRTVLHWLAGLFFVTSVAELVATRFGLGAAGFFAASFEVFFGGVLLGLAEVLEGVRGVRDVLERVEGELAECDPETPPTSTP